MRYLLLLGGLCLACSATAEIYRWTDASGQVHYGERPPPLGAERVYLPTDDRPATADTDAERRREHQRRLLDAYEHERAQKRSDVAQEARQRQVDAQRCQALERRWQALSHGGPIYYKRADGGRDYLDEEQRVAEKARIRPAYLQSCGREP